MAVFVGKGRFRAPPPARCWRCAAGVGGGRRLAALA